MSVSKSTALANHLAVTGSLKAGLDNGLLYIFSGPVPSSADDAIDGSSVLLATISVGGAGTGLTFAAEATNGVLTKTASESWQGTIAASGTATFARFCESGDSGTATTTTARRLQFTVGTDATAGLVLSSVSLVQGNTQAVNTFQLY